MRVRILDLTAIAIAGVSSCIGMGWADNAASRPLGPVRIIAVEAGVVPPQTQLVVRTNEMVKTDRALRGTIYDASIAEEIQDQNGSVLIPRMSPVKLVVRRVGFLGPGGAGTSELRLGVLAITVDGVDYPVATADEAGNGNSGLVTTREQGVEARQVLTRGRRVYVPAETTLVFTTEDPIRLRGYRR